MNKKSVKYLGLLAVGFWLLAAPVLAITCKSGEAFDRATGNCISVAITQNLNCFSQDECEASPYKGHVSGCREPGDVQCAKQVSECQKEADGRNFYCYSPRITICQPDSKDTDCAVKLEVAIGGKTIEGLEGYIAALYKWLVAISGILAGLMITYAGVKWMLASGNPEKINEAKHKVGDAIIGLILVVGSYVIMQTINPALVSLQMPPVKIARQLGISTQGKCALVGIPQSKLTKDPELKKELACGQEKFDCSKLPEACGGVAAGSCIGQLCEIPQEKCIEYFTEEMMFTGKYDTRYGEKKEIREQQTAQNYTCFNTDLCPKNCDGYNSLKVDQKTKEEMCKGVICFQQNKTSQLCIWKNNNCVPRALPGENCTVNGNMMCASGICNTGKTIATCAAYGGDPAETRCNLDRECESGLCNKGYIIDQCSPKGGETKQGAPCDRSEECHYPMICNTRKILGVVGAGECWPYPGPKGAPCRGEDECVSRSCSEPLGGIQRCD
ncbi:MAG: pilin [bacterium]|nr:pilin [bacterium]